MPCSPFPPPPPLSKTGQATSWGAGDDGDLEGGVAWPNPRFADNGDGTITDNLTGLIWLNFFNFIKMNGCNDLTHFDKPF